MKKIILSLALVTGLTTISMAQDATTANATKQQTKKEHTPEERSQHSAKWAEKNLGLNADQKSQWQVAALKRAMANQPLIEKHQGSTTPEERKDIRKQMKANEDAFTTSVNAFLTADQKTKYEQIKQQKHAAHKAKAKGGKEDDLLGEDIEK